MTPILAFLGGAAGLVGGAILGLMVADALGLAAYRYVIAGLAIFVGTIAGYASGARLGETLGGRE